MSKPLHGGVRSHALDLSSLPITRFLSELRQSPHLLNAQLGAVAENDLEAASAFIADESLVIALGQAHSLSRILSAQASDAARSALADGLEVLGGLLEQCIVAAQAAEDARFLRGMSHESEGL